MTQNVLLGDVAMINPESVGKGYPYEEIIYLDTASVTENTFSQSQHFRLSEAPSRAKRIIRDGDIVYSTVRPNLKHFGYIQNPPSNAIASTGFAVIRAKDGVDSRYLYYWLTSNERTEYLAAIADSQTSTFPAFQPSVLERLKIRLPDLDNQKKISSILSSFDEKIELNRRMNETLEQMGQALFRHYFIDNPEVGRWVEKPIYDFSDVVYGAPFASKLFNETGDGRPLIRIRDLKTQKPRYWTTEDHPKGTLITAGDIVVGMDAEFRPYIWAAEDAWLNQRVCQFVPKGGVPRLFVLESIRPWLNFYERGKIGTTVIHLGKSDIDKFMIKNPPSEILEEFSKLADPIYDMRVKNSHETQALTTLRDTLLPRLISGRIKI